MSRYDNVNELNNNNIALQTTFTTFHCYPLSLRTIWCSGQCGM